MDLCVYILFYLFLPGSFGDLWSCYQYSAVEENEIRNISRPQKSVCERKGRVFTQGKNTLFPGCQSCPCCQKEYPWKCYEFNSADNLEIQVSGEKAVCEKYGYDFTNGKNNQHTGCGTCLCCQRKVPQQCYECKHFFSGVNLISCIKSYCRGLWSCYNYCSADWNEIKNLGIPEKSVCELHGRVFTKAENKYHPGCGTCRCCQRSENLLLNASRVRAFRVPAIATDMLCKSCLSIANKTVGIAKCRKIICTRR